MEIKRGLLYGFPFAINGAAIGSNYVQTEIKGSANQPLRRTSKHAAEFTKRNRLHGICSNLWLIGRRIQLPASLPLLPIRNPVRRQHALFDNKDNWTLN